MFCSSKKKAQDPEPLPTEPPAFDFKVEVRKSQTETAIGLKVLVVEKKMLCVSLVKEAGLVPEWNKAHEATPELIVNDGCLIVAVNGVFGDSQKMTEKLQESIICLCVKRGEQKDAPAESAPLAADPAIEVTVEPVAEQEPAAAIAATPLAADPAIEVTVEPVAEKEPAAAIAATETFEPGTPELPEVVEGNTQVLIQGSEAEPGKDDPVCGGFC